MAVRDLYFAGITAFPAKADAPLVIDPDAVLACSLARVPLQTISRRNAKVLYRIGGIENQELPKRAPSRISG